MSNQMIENIIIYCGLGCALVAILIAMVIVVKATNCKLNKTIKQFFANPITHDKEPFKVGQTVWYLADSGDRICTFKIDRIEVFSHVYSGLKTYVYFDKSGHKKLGKDLFDDFEQAVPALDERLRA